MSVRRWSRRTREPHERSGAAGGGAEARERPSQPSSPYSDQYETIISQGHTRPSPSFGAPALVWHVAIWPRRCVDGTGEPCDPHDTAGSKHIEAKREFEERRRLWLECQRRSDFPSAGRSKIASVLNA